MDKPETIRDDEHLPFDRWDLLERTLDTQKASTHIRKAISYLTTATSNRPIPRPVLDAILALIESDIAISDHLTSLQRARLEQPTAAD